ncbi:MAG: class I SAM-dependent methyltransferase [Leptospirales bacterium]|nr:class I SAM-dependent methyltransferase [Leptospirales bacterium]
MSQREFHPGDEQRLPLSDAPQFSVGQSTATIYYENARSVDYGPDYFLEEYRTQYGRSYMEDEAHLRRLAQRRLRLLGRAALRRRLASAPRLLEIGCAAGFFLDEARRIGFETEGVEISTYASSYARQKLQLSVQNAGLLELPAPTKRYDVIAAFYVLEHFPQQRQLFQWLSTALKPGGALLFALPSSFGPLFCTQRAQWADTHPVDHFADYSPSSLQRTLNVYGMTLGALRPASYHPLRARDWRGALFFRPFYRMYADARAFGDTMEGSALRLP